MPNPAANAPAWSAVRARERYNLPQWGEGYFDVSDAGPSAGHVVVRPFRDAAGVAATAIDLHEIARRLPLEGLELPVLVRFNNILEDRVDALTGAFAHEIEDLGYTGRYTAVYPIKVNQQADVVNTIVRHGGARVGLEAGSKPELAAVLGLAPPGCLIVCNGYKDRGYIRRALIGQKLGHTVYIVVEKLSELPIVLAEAAVLDVAPVIGLRVRLAADSTSTQQNTGGEKAKFGLATPQILEAVEMLRAAGRLDSVQMVHFHLGSQVAAVQDIARGLREAARFYVELRRLGAPIDTLDVGGGLGVDYEGTRSRSHCSMNYGLREYARNILRTVRDVCVEAGEPQPNVISESGRALTAHHAVLVTSVIDQEVAPAATLEAPPAEAPSVLQELHGLLGFIEERPIECLHDAQQLLGEAHGLYAEGQLSLGDRAYAERAYFAVAGLVKPQLDDSIRSQRDAADALDEKLSAKYFCNFSVFQSVPDAWAIEQVFPILPIHRLDEEPAIRARLCDLTCDSDGRLDRYVDREGVTPTLALHELREGEPYLIGIFMIGAYQEILGDIHNLFGDTNAINVVLDRDAPDGWRLEGAEHGDRTDELLRYVHLAPEALAQSYRKKLAALNLPQAQRNALLAELEAGLSGYTYLS